MIATNETCPRNDVGCPCTKVPEVVSKSLEDAAMTFVGPIRWDHLAGCYIGKVSFGITVGIETDGYIHS